MLNQCTFIGRLTRTPELRHTKTKSKPVTSFTLAIDRDRADADGNYVTDFIDFVAYDHLAQRVCERYGKGDLIVAVGRLQPRPYTNKQGVSVVKSEIVVENCRKLRSPKSAVEARGEDDALPDGYTDVSSDPNAGEVPF